MSTYTDLLREVARLVDEHDLIPADVDKDTIYIHVHATEENPRVEAAKWRRALGGQWEKGDLGSHGLDTITLSQDEVATLPGQPDVTIFLDKDACVARVVGVEEVVVPAVEAQPERVELRDVIEWDCEPVTGGVR